MYEQKSTTVRFQPEGAPARPSDRPPAPTPDLPWALPPRAPVPVRAVFRLLDPLAPGLAARLVDHLWFRLRVPPTAAKRGEDTPPGGRPFVTASSEGLHLHGLAYGPDDAPLAVLVHGWAGWWQQLAAQVEPLLAAGYRVVAYDAPSHGSSPPGRYGPRSSRVMELADAYAAVVLHQGAPDLVVAHSIGAMATLWAARERGVVSGAYVFLAAAASVHPMVDFFRHTLALGPRTPDRVVARVEHRIGHRFADFEAPVLIRALQSVRPAPPLLAIHDRRDRMTPPQGTVDIGHLWPGGETELTDGLGHNRLLRDDAVVDRVARFAVQHRPQPS